MNRRTATVICITALAAAVWPWAARAAETPRAWNIVMDRPSFAPEETVGFCLRNDSRIPFFYGPDERPWSIVDAGGRTVFSPSSVSPQSQPTGSFNPICDRWDQRDRNGRLVGIGTYRVVFHNTIYVVQPAEFTIVRPDDRGTKLPQQRGHRRLPQSFFGVRAATRAR